MGGGALTAETLVVYPTALKARSALHHGVRAAGALVGHRITTFPELTDALARDLGVPARVLDPEMAVVVLAHALAHHGIPAPFRAPRRGLVQALLRVIAEFKAAYLAPEDVTALAAGLPAGAADRLAALGRVYGAYDDALARLAAVDRHGREWRVCEALAAAEAAGRRPPTLAGVGRIVFAELYDFSVLQFLIATALIRLVGDAELVAFAHPENVDATRFLDRTWNRFVADPGIADQVLPSFVVRGGRQGSLAAVLRGVFTEDRPPPLPSDGSVRLVIAPSRYREVEAAVRDVRVRLERGERPERMALLTRDLGVYGDLIEDVCRRYRVPVHFRKGRPLLANGLVRACLDVMRCVAEGFPRARLEALLDTDYFAAPPRGLARILARVGFVADAVCPLRACVAHRMAALALAAEDPERAGAARIERTRLEAAAAPLLALVESLRALDGRRTPAGHVRALQRTLRHLKLRPVPRGDGSAAVARRDARAWEQLQAALDELGGLTRALGVEAMPLADFLRLLVGVLEPLQIDDAADHRGVRALGVLDARGLDFDTVWLLGLDDGTFPAPRAESPLWPDALKRQTNPLAAELLRRKLGPRAAGLPLGGLLRTAREASLEDPFLFFLALSMAEREVVLSYPAVDERGNPTVPSPFLDEVRGCTLLPETVLDPTALVPRAEDCCEVAELIGRASLARWSRRPGAAPDRLSAALAEIGPDLGARLVAIDARALVEERRARYFFAARGEARKEALADAFVGRLAGDPGPLPERLAAMRWSPRRLDALGACGFKFYARHILGLAEEDDPETGVGPAERGTLVHAVLETLLRDHPRLPADVDAARALGQAVVARARTRAAATIPPKDPAVLDVAWQQVAAAVDALVVREHAEQAEHVRAGLTIDRFLERPLGWSLPVPGGALVLGGRPDRVDVRRRDGRALGLRVIDYKMSRDPARYAPLLDPERELGRTSFQVPVYLLGALAAVDDLAPDGPLEGGYLLLLAERTDLIREFSRADLDAVAERIVALVERAGQGRFDVDPEPCDPYCRYRPVCRYQRPPLEEAGGGG